MASDIIQSAAMVRPVKGVQIAGIVPQIEKMVEQLSLNKR